jgi:hypothetical protein
MNSVKYTLTPMLSPVLQSCSRFTVALALVTGIALSAQGGLGTLNGSMTSGGGVLLTNYRQPSAEPMLMQGDLHGAASLVPAYESAAAARQLVMGMLLILFGFFLHAFTMSNGERSVRVHEASSPDISPDQQTEDMMPFEPVATREKRWYWMEIKM